MVGADGIHIPDLLGSLMIIVGAILAMVGSIGLTTPLVSNCPASGCPPLTPSQLWQIYGTNYIELYVAISLIIIGILLVLVSRFSLYSRRDGERNSELENNLPVTNTSYHELMKESIGELRIFWVGKHVATRGFERHGS
ncbi:MAG: hypothetical protein ACYC7D_12285 [Nitrososphaerales archaeon]